MQLRYWSQLPELKALTGAQQRRFVGTGFGVWWNFPTALSRWHDEKQAMFPAVYEHHDAGTIPSLRAEAFREGTKIGSMY
jgi:hypothetical protein